MPRRKQTKRTTVKDLRTILRLAHEHGLSVRAISERLRLSKTSVATYLWRAREAGLSWPLPPDSASDAALERVLFRRMGRPPRDLSEPDWRYANMTPVSLIQRGLTRIELVHGDPSKCSRGQPASPK